MDLVTRSATAVCACVARQRDDSVLVTNAGCHAKHGITLNASEFGRGRPPRADCVRRIRLEAGADSHMDGDRVPLSAKAGTVYRPSGCVATIGAGRRLRLVGCRAGLHFGKAASGSGQWSPSIVTHLVVVVHCAAAVVPVKAARWKSVTACKDRPRP